MLSHTQIWKAIDSLAKRHDTTPSGLAKKAGLDATTFNPSKRFKTDGRPRWPSTESISKILEATQTSTSLFFALDSTETYCEAQDDPLKDFPRYSLEKKARRSVQSRTSRDETLPLFYLPTGAPSRSHGIADLDRSARDLREASADDFDHGPSFALCGNEEKLASLSTLTLKAPSPAAPGCTLSPSPAHHSALSNIAEGVDVFALLVSGRGLSPLYREGDILIVSREPSYQSGERLLICSSDRPVLCRTLAFHNDQQLIVDAPTGSSGREIVSLDRVIWVLHILWASQ